MSVKTINHLELEDVHNLFDSVIFLRGEEYFEEGLVTSIEPVNIFTLTGTVRGNQIYTVSISIDADGDIRCDCSCPCDFNCKHAAALLLKWLSIKESYRKRLRQVKPPVKETLAEILSKKSKTELITLVETIVENHPELKTYVTIEKGEIFSKVKKLFSSFLEWYEVKNLIHQLEVILKGIKNNRNQWDKDFFEEMKACSLLMRDHVENMQDEGELGSLLEDWFRVYGEIFAHLKPDKGEKNRFIQTVVEWMNEEEYGFDGIYMEALYGMCQSREDVLLIEKHAQGCEYYDNYYKEFLLRLYDKVGMDERYMKVAQELGLTVKLIDKLISLGKLEEALKVCKKNSGKEFSETIENKKIAILRRLGRKKEVQKNLFRLLQKTGRLRYFLELKEETPKGEWRKLLRQIISDAEQRKKRSLLSRIYYNEGDYEMAYKYAQGVTDLDYLELLAKKLSINHADLACKVFRKLCFEWIRAGSGWPYKKAGKMLEAIKRLDKEGGFYRRTKQEIIQRHKKKWSLIEVIEKI